MRSLSILIFTLIGCSSSVTEENFINSYAQERCAKIFSCVSQEEQGNLEDIYGSQEDCAADMKADLESSLEGNSLEYSPTQGSACIVYLEESGCEEAQDDDPCSNVYVQPN
jgi:hypothetical protein